MQEIIKKIIQAEKQIGLQTLANKIGVEYGFLWSLKKGSHNKYHIRYIDELYRYFDLPKDKRYYDNAKLRQKKTYSVIGSILRNGRIRAGFTVEELARHLRGDKRQIMRIEHGDSLPSVNSYYISEMLDLFTFTDEEKIKIKYGIAILQDLLKIQKKYDP